MRQPAVIHGWGVRADGSEIVKSLTIAFRHTGRKNHRAGRNAIAAKAIRATKMKFVAAPSEARGGRMSRQKPRTVNTIPSAHFCVPPPKKQARTGNRAMAALPTISPVEMWRLLRLEWERGAESLIS